MIDFFCYQLIFDGNYVVVKGKNDQRHSSREA